MNKQQHIELIVAMLNELEDYRAEATVDHVAMYIDDDRFYELYTEVCDRYERVDIAKGITEKLMREGG